MNSKLLASFLSIVFFLGLIGCVERTQLLTKYKNCISAEEIKYAFYSAELSSIENQSKHDSTTNFALLAESLEVANHALNEFYSLAVGPGCVGCPDTSLPPIPPKPECCKEETIEDCPEEQLKCIIRDSLTCISSSFELEEFSILDPSGKRVAQIDKSESEKSGNLIYYPIKWIEGQLPEQYILRMTQKGSAGKQTYQIGGRKTSRKDG